MFDSLNILLVKLNNLPSEVYQLNFIQPNNTYDSTTMILLNPTCIWSSLALVWLISNSILIRTKDCVL